MAAKGFKTRETTPDGSRTLWGDDTKMRELSGGREMSGKPCFFGHAHSVQLDTVSDRLADRMIAGRENGQTFYARSHEPDNLITFVS